MSEITRRCRRVGSFLAAGLVGGLLLAACGGAAEPSSKPEAIDVVDVASLEEHYTGLGVASPPISSPTPAQDKSVWIIVCDAAVPGCQLPAAAAEEAGAVMGIDTTICDGKYNEGGAWTTCVESATAAKADMIILQSMACDPIVQPLTQAREAGIKVMGVLSTDCENGLFDVDMKYSELMPDNEALYYYHGVAAASHIINESNGEARILTSEGPSEAHLRLAADGFRDTIESACPSCEIVNSFQYTSPELVPEGPWIQNFRSQLVQYGADADAVFLPWDVMMVELGGAQAVEEANLRDSMIVFGGQGMPSVFPLLQAGQIDAITAGQTPEWMGYGAMDNANRALNGEETVPQGIGYNLITQDRNMPSGEFFDGGTVDWRQIYLESWGAA